MGPFLIRQQDQSEKMQDETLLTTLNMAGTHDSCTGTYSNDRVGTQHHSLRQQLDMDVQFSDIRLRRTNDRGQWEGSNADKVYLLPYHGPFYLGQIKEQDNFTKILEIIRDYINSHPDRFIIARVKEELDHPQPGQFGQMVDQYLNNCVNLR